MSAHPEDIAGGDAAVEIANPPSGENRERRPARRRDRWFAKVRCLAFHPLADHSGPPPRANSGAEDSLSSRNRARRGHRW